MTRNVVSETLWINRKRLAISHGMSVEFESEWGRDEQSKGPIFEASERRACCA